MSRTPLFALTVTLAIATTAGCAQWEEVPVCHTGADGDAQTIDVRTWRVEAFLEEHPDAYLGECEGADVCEEAQMANIGCLCHHTGEHDEIRMYFEVPVGAVPVSTGEFVPREPDGFCTADPEPAIHYLGPCVKLDDDDVPPNFDQLRSFGGDVFECPLAADGVRCFESFEFALLMDEATLCGGLQVDHCTDQALTCR